MTKRKPNDDEPTEDADSADDIWYAEPTEGAEPTEPERIVLPDTLFIATGTKDLKLANLRIEKLGQTLQFRKDVTPDEKQHEWLNLTTTLADIEPQDETERMLAEQMVACHNSALRCFRLAAAPEQTVAGIDTFLKLAARLMAAYARHLETLNKYRGKGDQKVTVKHIHVAEGGQAIVGNIAAQEPARRRRRAPPQLAEQVEPATQLDTLKTAKPVKK